MPKEVIEYRKSGGRVIWVTGLSGSGKSTVCKSLWELLSPEIHELVVLDGDEIRAAFGNDLEYVEADRHTQISRIQQIAKMLSGQGLTVIVAALYAHPDLLDWNRQNLPQYLEVYLKARLEVLQARDTKGLYQSARDGMKDIVGVDIPWHEPQSPDLTFDTAGTMDSESIAHSIFEATGLVLSDGACR